MGMATHAEKRVLPYSPEEMYALVADVERYPEFLPWVLKVRSRKRETLTDGRESFTADLMIGFKMVREKYTSRVLLTPYERVDVNYIQGPLKYLNNHWKFKELFQENGTSHCEIDFFVDFEFKSRILQNLIGALFNEAVRRMVGAFETRAVELYGPR